MACCRYRPKLEREIISISDEILVAHWERAINYDFEIIVQLKYSSESLVFELLVFIS